VWRAEPRSDALRMAKRSVMSGSTPAEAVQRFASAVHRPLVSGSRQWRRGRGRKGGGGVRGRSAVVQSSRRPVLYLSSTPWCGNASGAEG
jgi:hypothetical protein